MQEIILYAVIAFIVLAMLYSVLGKDMGKGPDSPSDPADLLNRFNSANDQAPAAPIFKGPAAEGLTAIAAADSNFSLRQFVEGAKAAYGMILEAYAEGDKDTLANLLNDEVKELYHGAIDERTEKGLTQKTDLARLISADVVSASLTNKICSIRVLYKADLSTEITDADGKVVEGDADILSRIEEIWSYERALSSKDPNWVLSGVEPHSTSGDENAPDHSPDTV